MIELSIRFTGNLGDIPPFVSILEEDENSASDVPILTLNPDKKSYRINDKEIVLDKADVKLELGEILIFFPNQNLIQRFYRPSSNSNTILLTEQCDQVCLMCSQPPKNKDYLHWELYLKAAGIMPIGSILGISGGEPTLYKEELFEFLIKAIEINPSLLIHILTNAQHFDVNDLETLEILNENVLWGVPIYSENANEHDQIVGKDGAFDALIEGFNCLLKSGSRVELRTVLLQNNYPSFAKLSKFIARHFVWIEKWAIMQLEPMGYARIEWPLKFVDTTIAPENLENAVFTASSCGIHTELYNFPLCTVPFQLRKFCVKSISDWKQKYLPNCDQCKSKNSCCGFFEWYDRQAGYKSITGIT